MRVIICSKEPLYGQALASLLGGWGNMLILSVHTSAMESVEAAKRSFANVIVVDSNQLPAAEMEFLLGAEAYGTFSLIVLVGEGKLKVDQAATCRRSESPEALVAKIRQVGEKHAHVSIGRARERRRLGYRHDILSEREFEVAKLVAMGFGNRKISETVGIKEQSIKNLVSVILRKLGCENRVQVALKINAGSAREAT